MTIIVHNKTTSHKATSIWPRMHTKKREAAIESNQWYMKKNIVFIPFPLYIFNFCFHMQSLKKQYAIEITFFLSAFSEKVYKQTNIRIQDKTLVIGEKK